MGYAWYSLLVVVVTTAADVVAVDDDDDDDDDILVEYAPSCTCKIDPLPPNRSL